MSRIALVLAVVVAAPTAFGQGAAVFTSLGTGSQANGVSADGTVVSGQHNGLVFRWTAAGGFQNIAQGAAPLISGDGNTMSWSVSGSLKKWTPATGVTTLGTGVPNAISGDGSTIVGTSGLSGFSYRQSTGIVNLTPPAGANSVSDTANDVSFDGSIIVGSYSPPSPAGSVALRWNSGVATALGPIPGYQEDIDATAVSGDGSIVYGFGRGQGGYDAFRWTAATGVVGLGLGAAGFNIPDPMDVSGDGNIIVGSTFSGTAFEWRLGAGARDLKEVLETDFGIDLSNYTLEQCRGISADGRTLVGFGTDLTVGQRFGFVVTLPRSIPGPGALSLLMLRGVVVGRRRRS